MIGNVPTTRRWWMLNRAAAIIALRELIDAAPTIDVAGVREPMFDLNVMVNAVLAAANPDALVVPKYDAMLAQSARYRLETDTVGPGAKLSITAHPGAVALDVHSAHSGQLVAGMVAPDSVWHTGLAMCSAAEESRRQYEGQGT
jgi:hypothetical protein